MLSHTYKLCNKDYLQKENIPTFQVSVLGTCTLNLHLCKESQAEYLVSTQEDHLEQVTEVCI